MVLVVSTLTVMGCLGFARFGYTLILPSMQAALDLSNTQTGALATANFVGYVILGVLSGFVASRFGPRRVVAVSMLVVGVTMVATGFADRFWGALVWRVLTGVGSGGANVPVMALLPAWFAARRRGLASGIAVSGSSLGLIVTGWVVPRILEVYGTEGWRSAWFMLGAAVLALGVLGWALLRDRPEEKGLQPIGLPPSDVPERPETAVQTQAPVRKGLGWQQIYRTRAIWHLALVYVAFGFSYVIYATFFARYLQVEGGSSADAAGNLWAVVGWISVFCGLIWGSVSDAIGRQYGLALVYLVQAISFALFALWPSPAGHWISTVLFGLTAWSIPGIVSAACGDCVGARLAPAAFGFVTLFFGLGQAAGPSVAGILADRTGSFGPAFLLAAGVAFLGGVGSLLLRPQCDLPAET
jgi:sugar phosphate permease